MLSDEEVEELQEKRDEQLQNGEIEARTCCTRSDKGKKHKRHLSDDNQPSQKKYKSTETILDSNDEATNLHNDPDIPADDNPTNSMSATLTTIDTC